MKALRDALIVTTMYCWIASGGLTFGAVFSACGGRQLFSSVLLSLPYPQYTVIAVSVALLFILGMFLDTITIIIVFGSILAPIIHGLGYDPVWWGVIFCTALIASYLTPPVAPAIYYFKSLRPEEPMDEIIRAVIPFTLLVAITVITGIIFPETVMFFIRLFYKG
jgi:TRAP-type mannitol/chloroaromatic compound transport system permease large subunit